MASNTFGNVGYYERGGRRGYVKKKEPGSGVGEEENRSRQISQRANESGRNQDSKADKRKNAKQNESKEMNSDSSTQAQINNNGTTPMSYALVVGNNNEARNKFQFKNMLYKDKRSDEYIKRGLWWYRPKELCLEDFIDYFTDKYGKGCIDMIYQVAYKKIEAYAKDEAMALMIAEEKVVIGDIETKINLINTGPLKICVKNIMPWLTISEIKEALQSYGEVIEDTVEYLPVKRNMDKNGLIASGQVVLYLNKKNQVQMPFYITPKINNDYHRWYMAPMSVQCYNCGEFGHWLRFCGKEHDQDKIDQRKNPRSNVAKRDDESEETKENGQHKKDNIIEPGESNEVEGKGMEDEENSDKDGEQINEEQCNARETLMETIEKDRNIINKIPQIDETMVDGVQRNEVMRKCDDLEEAINNKDYINLEEEVCPITQDDNGSKNLEKTKMGKCNAQGKKNSKRRKVEQHSQRLNKVDNYNFGEKQPDMTQEEPMEEEEESENEQEGIIDSSENSDEDNEESRTVEDVIQSLERVNDMFEHKEQQMKDGEGIEMESVSDDQEQYNNIVQILKSAIKNRRMSRKQYLTKDLEQYNVDQLELFKKKYEISLEQGEIINEMNNFIKKVAKYKKPKTPSPLQINFENPSNKGVMEVRSQRLRCDSRSRRGSFVNMKDESIDRSIPQCTTIMTQLIKRVDQSGTTMDEKGNIAEVFSGF